MARLHTALEESDNLRSGVCEARGENRDDLCERNATYFPSRKSCLRANRRIKSHYAEYPSGNSTRSEKLCRDERGLTSEGARPERVERMGRRGIVWIVRARGEMIN